MILDVSLGPTGIKEEFFDFRKASLKEASLIDIFGFIRIILIIREFGSKEYNFHFTQ